jgi:toxin ParE1/3/4
MKYEISYLPLAKKDLTDIVLYISDILKSPKAALDLLNSLEESILRLEQFPFSCKVYQPLFTLENEYRLLPVKNYQFSILIKKTRLKYIGSFMLK